VLCGLLGISTQVWEVGGACFVVGVGLGLLSSPTLVAVQSVVGWERRGVVTGTNMFCRSMGSAVGAAVFGAIANATLADRLSHPPAALAGRLPRSVDATSAVLGVRGPAEHSAVSDFIRVALYDASHNVFISLVVVAVLLGVAILVMPRRTVPLDFD
jgi:hypothetical protein